MLVLRNSQRKLTSACSCNAPTLHPPSAEINPKRQIFWEKMHTCPNKIFSGLIHPVPSRSEGKIHHFPPLSNYARAWLSKFRVAPAPPNSRRSRRTPQIVQNCRRRKVVWTKAQLLPEGQSADGAALSQDARRPQVVASESPHDSSSRWDKSYRFWLIDLTAVGRFQGARAAGGKGDWTARGCAARRANSRGAAVSQRTSYIGAARRHRLFVTTSDHGFITSRPHLLCSFASSARRTFQIVPRK